MIQIRLALIYISCVSQVRLEVLLTDIVVSNAVLRQSKQLLSLYKILITKPYSFIPFYSFTFSVVMAMAAKCCSAFMSFALASGLGTIW